MPDTDKSKDDDHVSIPRIPKQLYHIFALVFMILVIGYLGFEFWSKGIWESLRGGLFERVSVLMTLVIGFSFIIAYIYNAFKARRERKRHDEAKKEGATEALKTAEEFLKEGRTLRQFLDAHKNE